MKRFLGALLPIFLIGSYLPDPAPLPRPAMGGDTLRYLFMGHTYDWQAFGDQVDPRLEGLDYGGYRRIMLGGDICSETLGAWSTLEYLDSLFDLHSPRTHFVMGNHDARNENHEWLEEITGRKTYSTHSEAGLTVVVLNTTLNPGDCEELDAQYRMLERVCDTIRQSSHLMVLQHHGTWNRVPGLPNDMLTYSNWPYPFWDANCYQDSSLYLQAVYPLLVKVQRRGVEVINVMGDAGVRQKGIAMQSTDGIWYIASGIDNSRYANDSLALDTVPKDKLLLFEHVPEQRKVTWHFVDLDSLAGE